MKHLTDHTEPTAACNAKVLCHSQTVWGNEPDWLLASSSLQCQGTLSYQHRWSTVLERSLERSPKTHASLTNDSLENWKWAESQWPCLTKCTVKTLGRPWKAWGTQSLALLWGRGERRVPVSCTHCLLSNRDVFNLSWCRSSASAEDTTHPSRWYKEECIPRCTKYNLK